MLVTTENPGSLPSRSQVWQIHAESGTMTPGDSVQPKAAFYNQYQQRLLKAQQCFNINIFNLIYIPLFKMT